MHGFYNRLLRVDLSERTWTAEAISNDVLTRYLDGKGLVAYPLLENAPTVVDPLAPENPFILINPLAQPWALSWLLPAAMACSPNRLRQGFLANPMPAGTFPPQSVFEKLCSHTGCAVYKATARDGAEFTLFGRATTGRSDAAHLRLP